MHQSIRCQIVRGIHCSTQHAEYHHCSTSRRGEEPSAVVRVVLLLEPHGGASVLLFFISDKVHVYSGEGRKTAAQHVMMISINQPCSNISWPPCEPVCVFSLLVSLKERRVGHFAVNWDRFAHTPVPHVSDMPRGGALTDWPYAYLVLHLHTTPPSVTVYRARFIMMHFSQCISTTRETLDAFGLMLN